MIWEKRGSQKHADCRVFTINQEHWECPSENLSGDFFIVDVRDWAVALAQTEDGRCVMVSQFRFGSESLSLEFPAGLVDDGETPIEAAERELYEESGYRGENAKVIGSIYPNPAIQRNKCHFVLIENAKKVGEGSPDPHEVFQQKLMHFCEIEKKIASGEICHSIVLTALYYVRPFLSDNDPIL